MTPEQPTPAAPAAIDVRDHIGLVHHTLKRRGLARRHDGGAVQYADLVQEGMLGLVRAAETFDAEKGAFSTYGSYWIRQHATRFLQNRGSVVRIPIHLQDRRRREGVRVLPGVRRIEAPISNNSNTEGESSSLLDLLADEDTPSPEEMLEAREARAELARIVTAARLNPQEQVVIGLRAEGLTLEAIGERMQRTRERARQVEMNAMRKLKKAAGVPSDVTGGVGRRYTRRRAATP
jgi:RNA polymerase sigma factor (sigma-70 family)